MTEKEQEKEQEYELPELDAELIDEFAHDMESAINNVLGKADVNPFLDILAVLSSISIEIAMFELGISKENFSKYIGKLYEEAVSSEERRKQEEDKKPLILLN